VDASVAYQRRVWEETAVKSLAAVASAGVEVIRPDLEPFRTAVKSIWDRFEGTEIGKLARRIQEGE